jgi:DNA helicase-2/ATP-dependent DNA helicase PcrA
VVCPLLLSYYAESELDAEDTQRRFAYLKLFVNTDDRVALRWLLGQGSSSWLSGGYARLRSHCQETGEAPWQSLSRLHSGTLRIPHTATLVAKFSEISEELSLIEELGSLGDVVDHLFPADMESVRDLRALASRSLETADNDDRRKFMADLEDAITKPEVPSQIDDVRIMSLHKSKGLSAPVTIIAGCFEGLLPMQPTDLLPQAAVDAQLEEQRRLFYVGVTRVKAHPDEGKPGTLILSYSTQMSMAEAMKAGIRPASSGYGLARLHGSRFIGELGPHAPRPVAG